MKTVDFYFDLSSPWTCLAFHNIQPIIQENDAAIIWKPFLVGGVFNAVNQDVYAARENPDNRKVVHSFRVLKDWAALAGLPMNFPSAHHPVKSVHAMRLCAARTQEQAIKDRLRANTEEAIARGAFGSPSIFVPFGEGEKMYFGNDQLPLVNWAIKQG